MGCLLDVLAEKCGTQYLSDLKLTGLWKDILREMNPADYPLEDWNETVNYLYDVQAKFKTCEDARDYLLK